MELTRISRLWIWVRCCYANTLSRTGIIIALLAVTALVVSAASGYIPDSHAARGWYAVLLISTFIGLWLFLLTGSGMRSYSTYIEARTLRTTNMRAFQKKSRWYRIHACEDYCGSVGYRLEKQDWDR